GDAVGCESDSFANILAPILFGLAHHPGDQVDIHLRESDGASEIVDAADFLRAVRAAVQFEDRVVKILDTDGEARDAQLENGAEFLFGDGARLALERDLLGVVPRERLSQLLDRS